MPPRIRRPRHHHPRRRDHPEARFLDLHALDQLSNLPTRHHRPRAGPQRRHSGVGDLHATCASPLSRNRTFGEHLGQGMTVEEATVATKQTAEGVKSCRAILELARRNGVEMPYTEVVAAVLDGRLTVEDVASDLMSRTSKPER
ncbi:NAD(P)H-dependent glycerol-3-phosphate dehydrogenase [Streptomyces sp. NPDC056468]|uniref:NAD(P)H-dependent glycerol-3-phosphate dehydrogenase n=1 Tax=Streptomyces sp. NPDC056468 TaxID=3345830 RepID=UPI0036C7D1C1